MFNDAKNYFANTREKNLQRQLCSRQNAIRLIGTESLAVRNRQFRPSYKFAKMFESGSKTFFFYSQGQTKSRLVSFAAVTRVVTQCSSPTMGCSLEPCIPFHRLTNKEQASISWKPGPRNMIGAAANSYMHVVGSQ